MFHRALIPIGFWLLLAATACTRQPPPVTAKVLFDQGHGQRSLLAPSDPGGFSELARIFQEQGLQPVASQAPLSSETLTGCTAVVIAGPMAPLTNPELVSLGKFLRQGGQLCLLLKVTEPATPLLQNLGLAVSNRTINETSQLLDEHPTHFAVAALTPHPLTQGVRQFKIHDSLALNPREEANVLGKTSPQAWIDLNGNGQRDPQDAQQSFSVMVTGPFGRGRFAVFGSESLFQNQLLSGDNQQLAQNLARWLLAND